MPITSLGVGSGLDANGIISTLMSVEKRPLVALQSQEKSIKARMSSMGQMQSLVSDLQTAAQGLGSLTLWRQFKATSADEGAIRVSAANGATAGSYSVAVRNLATAQTATSAAFPSGSAKLGTGELTIELGSWGEGQDPEFAPKEGATPVTIRVGEGDNSLSKVRDKINAANAGVTATIINDASGARLSIVSKSTGQENGFRIAVSEDEPAAAGTRGLASLTYDASSGSKGLVLNQRAGDARATVNGIEVSSATNTLDGVTEGVTLTLLKATDTAVSVSVSQDTDSIKGSIEGFVKAFNALAGFIRTQTKYDAASKTGGTLQGDPTAVGLQQRLRAVLNQPSSASSTYSRLSDIGISMKADGTLDIKTGRLSEALANSDNLGELRKLFVADTGESATSGFATRFRALSSAMLSSNGALTTANSGLSDRVKSIQKRQDAMNDRLAATEERLRKQYQGLDEKMSKLGNLSGYVGAQLANMYR